MMSNLKGKTAVITGATSGIGFELAMILINNGVNVYLLGRSFDKLKKLLSKQTNSNKIYFIPVDLENVNEIKKIINQYLAKVKIDILIHSAGVISLGLIENEPVENLDLQYKINVRASYLITQILLPRIKLANGEIVFINSTAGLDSWEQIGQYSASKHALKALSKSLRKELVKDKIKVTNLYLGSVNTPMQKKVQLLRGNNYDPSKYLDPKEIAKVIVSVLELPKNVTITDMTILSN